MNPEKIIWINWTNFFTAKGGGGAYSRSVLNAISATFPDVEVIHVHRQTNGDVSKLRRVCALLNIFSAEPVKIKNGFDKAVGIQLQELTKKYPRALIVFNGAETFTYLPFVQSGFLLHVSHNVEHVLHGERIINGSWLTEMVATLLFERRRFKAFEIEGISKCDAVSFISPDDQFVFTQVLGAALPPSVVVQPSFNSPRCAQDDKDLHSRNKVGFVADFSWPPNLQGIQHFIDHCWKPKPGQVLNLFGKGSESFSNSHPSIVAHGWVQKLDDVWDNSDVMIAPIYWGGGINIKTCEAVYNRVPLVSTPMAVRGLPSEIRNAVTVLQSDTDWMEAIDTAGVPSQGAADFFTTERAISAFGQLFSLTENKRDQS
jgi:glycosyltransferase involved in cell wall biosynthesis